MTVKATTLHKYAARGSKHKEFDYSSVEIVVNYINTHEVFIENYLGKYLNTKGFSRSAFELMMILYRQHPQGYKQQHISRLLLVSRANITGLVNGLRRQKLIVREEHPSDRRAFIVRISEKGLRVIDELLPDYYQRVNKVLGTLNSREKKAFNGQINRLRQVTIQELRKG